MKPFVANYLLKLLSNSKTYIKVLSHGDDELVFEEVYYDDFKEMWQTLKYEIKFNEGGKP